MKSIQRNNSKKKTILVIISIVTLILVGSGVAYALVIPQIQQKSSGNTDKVNDVNYDKASDDQIQNGNNIKEGTVESTPSQPTDTLNLTTSSFKKNPSTYYVGVDINQVLSTGDCTLVLTSNSGEVKTLTSDIQPLPGYSTCKGFSIPISDLGTANWTFDATVTSGTSAGKSNGKIEL